MRIATWNINSVRLRTPLVLDFLSKHQPDILCLQETKVEDKLFPHDPYLEAGYKHIHISGMKSYNGVAIFSKLPFLAQNIHSRAGREDCRHIDVTVRPEAYGKDVHIHTLYIPAGGDIPDPAQNEKFKHKLDFVDEITEWFPKTYSGDDAVVAVGDFNIAPLEQDVWSHKQLLDVVSHTPIEVEKLGKMQKSLNWVDAARHFVPHEEKLYSWWSYRARDWEESNRGRRLDHVWVTEPLKEHLKAHETPYHWRGVEKPSDHVPVIIDLAF